MKDEVCHTMFETYNQLFMEQTYMVAQVLTYKSPTLCLEAMDNDSRPQLVAGHKAISVIIIAEVDWLPMCRTASSRKI